TVGRGYRHEGKDSDGKGLDRISFTAAVESYRPDKTRSLEFQVTDGRLTGSGKGTLHFDGAAGRLARGESRMTLRGTLTVKNAEDQEWLMRLTQEQTSRTTVMDKRPEK